MVERRPPRVLGGLHTVFWDYCTRREFRLQQCDECATYVWPPAPVCDTCLSDTLTWQPLSGHARLVSFCTFERTYYPECPAPWPVVLVRLDEGPLFISNPHQVSVDDLEAGQPMRVEFIDCADELGDFALPVFAPAGGES